MRARAGTACGRSAERREQARPALVRGRRWAARLGTALGALAVLLVAAPAHSGDKAMAEALFQQGKRLMQQGHLDEACPKLEASFEADPAIGALLNLALCHQKQGRVASAWAEFTEAADMARRAGDVERKRGAEEHARRLEPRLSRLTIRMDSVTPDTTIACDGKSLGEGSLGSALPVDPGDHRISASAPGHASWSTTVTVGPNGDQQSLSIPALEPLAAPEDEGAGAPAAESSTSDGQGIAGWVLAAAGGAALGVGVALGVVAMIRVSNAEDDDALCPNHVCSTEGREQIDEAEVLANASTALYLVGGALVVGGVVLLLTDPSSEPDDGYAALVPTAGPGGAALWLTGRF